MEGNNFNTNSDYSEKTLSSDILRELVKEGYGKNNKIIEPEQHKSLKFILKSEDIFKLTFGIREDSEEEDDNSS